MKDILIRELKIEDYEALVELWEEAGLPYKPQGRDSRSDIERQLKQNTSIYLVAETEGRMVGVVLGSHDGRKGWINRLAVLTAYRKCGIGRRLVEEVENRLRRIGIVIFACFIEDWNEISMNFFRRLGYNRHTDIFYLSKRDKPDI